MTEKDARAAANALVNELKKANAKVSGPRAPRIPQRAYGELEKKLQKRFQRL